MPIFGSSRSNTWYGSIMSLLRCERRADRDTEKVELLILTTAKYIKSQQISVSFSLLLAERFF